MPVLVNGVTRAVPQPVKNPCFMCLTPLHGDYRAWIKSLAQSSSAVRMPAACRAANSIMAQAHKLIVKNAVFPQAADGNAHAVLKIPVQPRLGMGGIFAVLQEGLGRAGKL